MKMRETHARCVRLGRSGVSISRSTFLLRFCCPVGEVLSSDRRRHPSDAVTTGIPHRTRLSQIPRPLDALRTHAEED